MDLATKNASELKSTTSNLSPSLSVRSDAKLMDYHASNLDPIKSEITPEIGQDEETKPLDGGDDNKPKKELLELSQSESQSESDSEKNIPVEVSFYTQFMTICNRSIKNLIRNPTLLLSHVVLSIFLGLLVGGVYYDSSTTLGGIQNRLGSILFILALIGFSSLSALSTFSEERLLFIRERSNGYYSVYAFVLSKLMFDIIPLRLLPSLILCSIAYFMVGFSTSSTSFIQFIIVIWLFSTATALLCLTIGSGMRGLGTANLIASVILLFKLLFSGLLINAGKRYVRSQLFFFNFISCFYF